MIRYHGTPITPEAAAIEILRGRHGMVSFFRPDQIGTVAEVCQSFVIDNGAFSFWRAGGGAVDVLGYLEFLATWSRHPGFDWCLIPDSIDGGEAENRRLVSEWLDNGRLDVFTSVPVWHLHESLDWLAELAFGLGFPRIALGSSGEFSRPGSERWEDRMNEAFESICDDDGQPRVKIHGLRMMDPTLFSRYPFSSVDSCNVARNIGIDSAWDGFKYGGAISKSARGVIMAKHCEDHAAARVWVRSRELQYGRLFG